MNGPTVGPTKSNEIGTIMEKFITVVEPHTCHYSLGLKYYTANFCNQRATEVQLKVVKNHGLQFLVASNSWLQFFSTDSCYMSNYILQSQIAVVSCNFCN